MVSDVKGEKMKLKKIVKICLKKTEIILSLSAFVLSGTGRRNRDRLENLRGTYRGKRCFIICNGPSLRADDLTKIYEHGDLSIGMNAIAMIYDQTPWRPDFLSATDAVAFTKKNKELIKNCACGYKLYDQTHFLKSLGAKENKLYLSFNESLGLLDNPQFSDDATKKLPSIGTSAYAVIEFAAFLGCTEMYILGCDMSYAVNLNRDGTITYNDSGKDHFCNKENDYAVSSNIVPALTWQIEIAFDAASKFAKEYGINIYNATRGGNLESFERVDFDTLF